MAPLKSFVTGAKNGLWGDAPEDSGEMVYCARVADFDRTRAVLDLDDEPTVRAVPPRKRVGRLLRSGDLLLEKSGGGEKQPVGYVVLVEALPGDTICSNFVARMPVAEDADPRFVRYLHQHYYSRRINTRSIKQSTGIQNLDAQRYLQELAPRPPLATQRAIASFLDRRTARIDTLMEKKRRLRDLLEEKRTALITRAVTRGLDPDVAMKDSGVEWMGEIPEHWGVSKVKHVTRLESGHTPSRNVPEYWVNCTVPWVTLADVGQIRNHDVKYIRQTRESVSELGLANSAARKLPSGTVVLSRTASVGFSAIMDGEMATSQDFANWVPRGLLRPEFLLYVFRGMKQEFRRMTMGSTHQTIYMPDIRKLTTPVPPLAEQDRIVAHIRTNVSGLRELSDKVSQAIALLQEHRSALISAAVTGSIDVEATVYPAEMAS